MIRHKPGSKGKRTSRHRAKRINKAKLALELWSQYVKARAGHQCQLIGEQFGNHRHVQCKGALTAMHGFRKGVYPASKLSVWNGYAGCWAIHEYLNHRECQWQYWLREQWGDDLYEARRREALDTGKKLDLDAIISSLRLALATETRGDHDHA